MSSRPIDPSTGGSAGTGGNPAFAELGLCDALLYAVRAAGYGEPTPIQAQAIPAGLKGRDIVGCARTGTGKTAAFVLPMLHRLAAATPTGHGKARVRALVLAPTRELAAQIGDSVSVYGRGGTLRHSVIFGGVSHGPQLRELQRGVDIVIATPGRLEDHLDSGALHLGDVEVLVLDEFDRMLDQGFLPSIKRVLRRLPTQRQTMLFSATMPPELAGVVAHIVRDPVRVAIGEVASTPELVDQSVCFVDPANKRVALERMLREPNITRALVFTRTKHGANRVAKGLVSAGIDADAIHGNKSQNARERALSRFKDGSLHVLVATDLAARGIDVDDISHVINFDLPVDPESYVHRIGRTARAGRTGVAFSLCTPEERGTLSRIERLIGQRIRAAAGSNPSSAQPASHAAGQGAGRSPSLDNGAPKTLGVAAHNGRPPQRPPQPRRHTPPRLGRSASPARAS